MPVAAQLWGCERMRGSQSLPLACSAVESLQIGQKDQGHLCSCEIALDVTLPPTPRMELPVMEIPVFRICSQPGVGASLSWGCPDPALPLDDIRQGTLLGCHPSCLLTGSLASPSCL